MARWIFLRHGESTANAGAFLAGWVDVPLTALGEAQAVAAGQALASEPLALVLCSDLSRAQRTAELALRARHQVSGAAPPAFELVPALRERNIGDWELERIADLRGDGRIEQLLGWATRPPGGESHLDLASRALPALAARAYEGPTLVVSHGGTIRTLLGLLDGLPLEQIGRNGVANATAVVRDLPADIWTSLQNRLGLT